jgi:uncharacterized iron-regulated membrane protein
MNFRKLIFWTHLVVGVVAGLIILTMTVTGVLMAYERQIVAAAERSISTVGAPAPGAELLSLEEIGKKLRGTHPQETPTGFTRTSEPHAAVLVNFGREATRFVDPYTGAVLGDVSKWRGFLHEVEHVHRDLALGPNAKGITGAAGLAFLGLVISGLYLWLPRRWNKASLQTSLVPSAKLRGRARQWNWHNAFGFWAALPLTLMIVTGVIMSYQWANNLLFRLTGNEPPPPRTAPARGGARPPADPSVNPFAGLDALWAKAIAQVPAWKSGSLRLAEGGEGPLTFNMDEGDGTQPHLRSQVVMNKRSGEVQRVESFATYNLGRKLRMWARFVHTGEAGGIIGQTIAALASLAGALLVWTGFALAIHRFKNRARNRRAQNFAESPVEPQAAISE